MVCCVCLMPCQGEKNAGFDVLYHNMKHGQLATKDLRESAWEVVTFAPMWDVFRVSSDKLALCHQELMRKMNDLIRDINKYGEEQVKIHRKTKEEMAGTVEAVQALQVQSGHLQKSKEVYHAKCLELDRLRKEGAPLKELEKAELKSKKAAESFALCIEKHNRVGAEFEQKMSESSLKFQGIEETHLRQMKQLIKGYSHSIEDTHVQVGQVHEEFKQNVENIGIENLIQKFAELKGTGKDKPALAGFEDYITALAPEGGKKSRAKAFRIPGLGKRDKESAAFLLDPPAVRCSEEKENNFYSSDSDFDDEEPKKFNIQIRPVANSNRSNTAATEKELKATVGTLTLPPNRGVGPLFMDILQVELRLSSTVSATDSLFGPPLESAFKSKSFDSRQQLRERSGFSASELHLSRGPSPISLSTQEAWPVAAAITEYINAYFKGGQHNRCLVKITGDLTMSFPAGIIRIFTANPNVPVLSFRLVNISRIDHFLPNQKLLYSDPSQSDPDTRDFWFNMQALQLHLQREAEANPHASYYNVGIIKYQLSSQDPGRAPLLLSAECQRSGTVTRVSLDYHCCPATAPSTQLTTVQVLLPLDHTATDLQCQPPASWNADERRLLWKLPNLSPTNHSKGSGTLCASWQCLEVPCGPPPSLAVQFVGSGTSLSGVDVELVGGRYRMSLVKKRFATGKYMAGCSL
uniref:FCH and mu domain containing endocytic adaptor 1 n=1 Tax=Takifugu rubripes TaxID=31033 RepID=H2TE09_TAKRU